MQKCVSASTFDLTDLQGKIVRHSTLSPGIGEGVPSLWRISPVSHGKSNRKGWLLTLVTIASLLHSPVGRLSWSEGDHFQMWIYSENWLSLADSSSATEHLRAFWQLLHRKQDGLHVLTVSSNWNSFRHFHKPVPRGAWTSSYT